ncbi:serine/threonine-protein phosphatase 6 regulatory ankyrin repeat subunit C-like [Gigantopelta aegis]|uniref:serine/threonine-protein phosphatase 6 regulatory ankyrin repeat subunit C-like n=1 Tax=Gigantopelta aegis TaxID=1735272 RepID=UPI001B88C857|nr:serine/threonine-protein phosphatase 6 regulatory ankyrin repeat subunit C-like [Gigantopelta aegis]
MELNESTKYFNIEAMPPEFNVLMQAISNCAGPVVHQILQQQPQLINHKGWHGNTALHRACLVGDISVVALLVNAGADTNTLNDSGESPVHYAAKRGIPSVLHILTKHGGDVTTTDKHGRRITHHASETGSVYMLHYLSTVHSVSFRDVDKKLQSPLHIVCGFGHAEAFKYLIRKERSDLTQGDFAGNTPMHLTVEEGHSHLTWLLLRAVGCGSLHHRNKAGYTPVDIACQRDKAGHKEITPLLKSYEGVRDHSYKPSGSDVATVMALAVTSSIYDCVCCSVKLLIQ